MFKLSHSKYTNALEKAQALQKVLEEENENLMKSKNNLSQNWLGNQSEINLNFMESSLLYHGHNNALLYTKAMTKIMGDYQVTIEQLMAKREQIGKQLQHDAYTAPDLSCFAEDYLIINYDYMSNVSAYADNVLLYTDLSIEVLRDMKNEAMECAAKYLDFSGVTDMLYDAKKRLYRVKNFKREFEDFANQMCGLEYDMSLELQNAKKEGEGLLYGLELFKEPETSMNERLERMSAPDIDSMLKERGLTIEQYHSALFDTLMYLDFFNDDEENEYYYENIKQYVHDGMTVDELLDVLSGQELYITEPADGSSTRHIYFRILRDAVETDPEFGEYKLSHMSRKLTVKDTGMEYNEGTNGIVFTHPLKNTIYVAYRGTSRGEWGDDGERFNCKNRDDLTPQMEQTLHYFDYVAESMGWSEEQEIYVTGHSQGGNDAQISILLSEHGSLVDACYSFDGEGHSPELLRDVENYLGADEYRKRVDRMYSISGEVDFVNRLGQKVIPEENTIYIRCNMDGVDVARFHDIVSMFCDEKLNYNGMINTGKGTSPSPITVYTAKAWEELYEMPPDMRASCQAALMNLLEIVLSKGEQKQGLNGEHATLGDAAIFCLYGINMLFDAGGDTAEYYIHDMTLDGAGYLLDISHKMGVSEEFTNDIYNEISDILELYSNGNEAVDDVQQAVNYIQWESSRINILGNSGASYAEYIKNTCQKMAEALENADEGFKEAMKDDTLHSIVYQPVGPAMPITPLLLKIQER